MDAEDRKFKCAVCGKPTLMFCSACRQVFYCSAKHQEEHWELHSSECVFEETPLRAESPPPEDPPAFHPDPNASLLADESVYHARFSVRKEVMVLLCQGNVPAALDQIKPHYLRSLSEYDRNRFFDVYDLLSDGFLYTKTLMAADELVPARQVLLQLYSRMVQHESTHKAAPQSCFRVDEAKGDKVSTTFSALKKKLTAYAVVATLFCACGDFVNGEKVYIQYVKVVEVQFGIVSLEASNAYFLMGLFYQEQTHPSRAIACFRRAMEIRIEMMGAEHETVADCLYNVGLVQKQMGNWHKSTEQLTKALKIREKNTSSHSLPVAQVLEALGKVHLATKDYRTAFDRLTQCYNIRKRLLKNPENEEIERVKTVLLRLSQKLDEEMEKDQARRVEMSLINPIETPDISPEKPEAFRRAQQVEARATAAHYSRPSSPSFEGEESPTTPGVTLLFSYNKRAANVPTPPSPTGLPGTLHPGFPELDVSLEAVSYGPRPQDLWTEGPSEIILCEDSNVSQLREETLLGEMNMSIVSKEGESMEAEQSTTIRSECTGGGRKKVGKRPPPFMPKEEDRELKDSSAEGRRMEFAGDMGKGCAEERLKVAEESKDSTGGKSKVSNQDKRADGKPQDSIGGKVTNAVPAVPTGERPTNAPELPLPVPKGTPIARVPEAEEKREIAAQPQSLDTAIKAVVAKPVEAVPDPVSAPVRRHKTPPKPPPSIGSSDLPDVSPLVVPPQIHTDLTPKPQQVKTAGSPITAGKAEERKAPTTPREKVGAATPKAAQLRGTESSQARRTQQLSPAASNVKSDVLRSPCFPVPAELGEESLEDKSTPLPTGTMTPAVTAAAPIDTKRAGLPQIPGSGVPAGGSVAAIPAAPQLSLPVSSPGVAQAATSEKVSAAAPPAPALNLPLKSGVVPTAPTLSLLLKPGAPPLAPTLSLKPGAPPLAPALSLKPGISPPALNLPKSSVPAVAASKLKPVRIDALAADKVKDTVWEKVDLPRLVLDDIERFFGKQQTASTETKAVNAKVPTTISLIADDKRVRAFDMAFTRAKKVGIDEFERLVISLDSAGISDNLLETLQTVVPTLEERNSAIDCQEPTEKLSPGSQLLVRICAIPRFGMRLTALKLQRTASDTLTEASKVCQTFSTALREVVSSEQLKSFLASVLHLGNALNAGTARGNASGLRVSCLPQVLSTKDNSGKDTVLTYLTKVLLVQSPAVLNFPQELGTLQTAVVLSMEQTEGEVNAVKMKVDQVGVELVRARTDGDGQFVAAVEQWLPALTSRTGSVLSELQSLRSQTLSVSRYLGEDHDPSPKPEVVLRTLQDLCDLVKTSVHAATARLKKRA